MQTGSVCKTLSITLFVLDAIGTIILAFIYANAGWHFAFGTFLIVLICGIFFGLISCVPLYAFGEILEYLDLSNQYLYTLSQATKGHSSSPTPTASSPAPTPFIRPQVGSSWVCSCGQHNDTLSQTCKNCGKYK